MKLAMLGTGTMGKAILAGLRKAFGEKMELLAWDAKSDARRNLDGAVRVQEPASWFAGGAPPDAVIVAVKPFDCAAALQGIVSQVAVPVIGPLWISIAAGKTIAFLQEAPARRGKNLPRHAEYASTDR